MTSEYILSTIRVRPFTCDGTTRYEILHACFSGVLTLDQLKTLVREEHLEAFKAQKDDPNPDLELLQLGFEIAPGPDLLVLD